MPSHTRLTGLPAEVMEGIVTLLELRDICSLRLTAGEVAAKSSQGWFKKHFRTKTIELKAPGQLEEFVCMTQSKQLGCLVQHLTLVGGLPTSPDHDQGAGEQEQDSAETLEQAMKNLRLNSASGGLRSVSLVVEGAGPGSRNRWQSIWEAAAECFQTAALALGASGLPIDGFDVFGRVARCSLACDRLASVLEKVDLTASLQGVKQLSVSLSHHRVHEPESEEMRSLATGERNTTAIDQLLGLCPQLEDLQLHWYNLRTGNLTDALLEEQRFFDRIADSCRFPSLERCSLKGIYTTGTTLLSFLRHHTRLSSLEMEELYLRGGNFRPVFSFLAKYMEHLEHVHVDDLWEERLIYFDAPGNPHFPSSGRPVGPNTLTRTGTDARRLIRYRFSRGHALDSAECANWDIQKRLHYGPPR